MAARCSTKSTASRPITGFTNSQSSEGGTCYVKQDTQGSDMPTRTRIQIGDVIEIPTTKGLAYAQYTHQHRTHGGLIRVIEPLFQSRPREFSELAKGPARFSTFFPVTAAV